MKSNAILRMREMRLIEPGIIQMQKFRSKSHRDFLPHRHHAQKERTPLPVFQGNFSMQFI